VAKCADAAASQIGVAEYREAGRVIFLPDVYKTAQTFAGMNSAYLAGLSIPVTVTDIRPDETSQVMAVTVSADMFPLLPSLLQGRAQVSITGYSQARIEGR
jgi:hypothetical protein